MTNICDRCALMRQFMYYYNGCIITPKHHMNHITSLNVFTWENWANSLSASIGIWPSNSWQQSLREGSERAVTTWRTWICPLIRLIIMIHMNHTYVIIYDQLVNWILWHTLIISSDSTMSMTPFDVRLRGVHGCGGVADVLGTLEHSEGQAS